MERIICGKRNRQEINLVSHGILREHRSWHGDEHCTDVQVDRLHCPTPPNTFTWSKAVGSAQSI
jgi:hypothetical protein